MFHIAKIMPQCKGILFGDRLWGRICGSSCPLPRKQDMTPSREDIEITRRLKEAGEILGIRVLDHIVVDTETGNYESLVEKGLLKPFFCNLWYRTPNPSLFRQKEASQGYP